MTGATLKTCCEHQSNPACPSCIDAARYRAIRPHLRVLNYDAARWGIWMPGGPSLAPFPMPADIDAAIDRLTANPEGA